MRTLEQEFEEYKARHKFAILKAKIVQYLTDIEDGQVNIPHFMREDSPARQAHQLLCNLVLTDIGRFNSLYEKAWCEIAPLLA